jgi:hypothetical protein
VATDVAWPLGYCMGYISGMIDTNDILAAVTKRQGAYCVPSAASVTQIKRVVVKYSNEHPEELHLPGMLLITNAFAKYFPCS